MSTPSIASLIGANTRDLGATLVREGVVYTAWSPEHSHIDVVVSGATKQSQRIVPLAKTKNGYFTALDPEGHVGDLYTMTVGGKAGLPDLASRFQPEGLEGPSAVVDPSIFPWQAQNWKRPSWQGQVVYELHIGTFTQEGTYQAAIERLDYLTDLGATVIEIMPLAQCTGNRNWGYDGVLLFAPYHAYGTPDELRAFVDACHLRGVAVMLDVVYNHIGAIGDCTDFYSKCISLPENQGRWGKSFNLHGENCHPVRHLLLQNMVYWLDEFRFDGFRLDATQAIHDESEKHLLVQATELIHARGAFVTAEDDRNTAEILRPRTEGGWQLDAVWSDDFHHTMRVSQTRENHSYLGRYGGTLEEIADTLRHGWYFRGQSHPKLKKPRGSICDHLSPEQFICCISNHDQVGNRPFGERLHQTITPEAYRALSLFFCLIPYTPMLFMGQEWATNSPFLFFTDHPPEYGRLVTEGRARDFQFDARQHDHPLPDCQAGATFAESKLAWTEMERPLHKCILQLYRDGLRLRSELFGNANPKRDIWKVEAFPERLSLHYRLPGQIAEITLFLNDSGSLKSSSGNTVIRSNDSCYAAQPGSAFPETIVRMSSHC